MKKKKGGSKRSLRSPKPKSGGGDGDLASPSAKGRALLRPRDLPPGLPRQVVRRQNIGQSMALRVSTWFTGNSRDSRQTWVPPTSNQRNSNDEDGGLLSEKEDDTKVIHIDDMDVNLGPKTTLGKTLQRLKKKSKSNPNAGKPIRQQDTLEKVGPTRSSDIKASFADESETSRFKNGQSNSEYEIYEEPAAPCWAYLVILFVALTIFAIGFGGGYAVSQSQGQVEFVVQPTAIPTESPTIAPTGSPTSSPTPEPTGNPTLTPTTRPTTKPTRTPTVGPTISPTRSPTGTPTNAPITLNPTIEPTALTFSPTGSPTTSTPTSVE